MYKILVIDDEIKNTSREEIYDFILTGKFEFSKVNNNIVEIQKLLDCDRFDCIILDNNLDIGESKSKVLKLIKSYDLPIIIVSNTRSFDVSDWDLPNVIDCISLKPFFQLKNLLQSKHVAKLKSIIQDTVKLSLHETEMRINKAIYKSRRYSNDTYDNRLTICHISDLQFGDLHTNPLDLNSFFSKLGEFINGRPVKPDLIAITGDIVFSGYESQFNLAKDVIEKFLNRVYESEKEDKIVLVPGNHDFNYNCFIVDENKPNYKLTPESSYNFEQNKSKNENIDVDKMINLKISPKDFEKFEGSDICLYNFSKFAYEITKDQRYFNSDFFIRKKSFLNKGFEIIGINNSYKFSKIENNKVRYEFDDNKITGNINNSKNKSIIIGHATPESLGFKQTCVNKNYRCNKNYDQECAEEGCQKWGNTERVMTQLNGIIYLHGHGHFSDYKFSDDKAKVFISAGSPSGINKTEKTVNVIEIEENSDTINLKIIVNECTSVRIKHRCNYNLSYDKKEKVWSEVKE